MEKRKKTIKYSVQFKFFVLFFVFIAVLLAFLNSYPLLKSRDLVFASKQSSLQSQAGVASSSLSALETLTPEGVRQVMELLDVSGLNRVIVTDEQGLILYDSRMPNPETGEFAHFAEVSTALEGDVVFHASFADGAFASRAAMPVRSWGSTIGSVYLYEYDKTQGDLLLELQSTIRSISLVVGGLALVMLLLFTRAMTGRMRELVLAIRVVRDGAYDYRVKPRGRDEITELGEEFNNMTAQLQETETLRRRFVSDASHELKTPLASIRLLSDSIVQSQHMDVETMREFVADIGSEAERLQRTSDKLLGLARLDAAPKVIERSVVDVAQVAANTLRLLLPLAEKRQVTLRHSLQEDCRVMGSADDLYQIIFNLVENAIKYNKPQGDVYLSVERLCRQVVIRVEDTGIGIPAADLPHIFSRFYRVDKDRSRASGGSGLGLSIVRDAVQYHGGSVQAQPLETGGSCFTVCFPLAEEIQTQE